VNPTSGKVLQELTLRGQKETFPSRSDHCELGHRQTPVPAILPKVGPPGSSVRGGGSWDFLKTTPCKEKVAALAPSGLVLVVDGKGNGLVAQNADESFVPASVTKIVTAWLALEVNDHGRLLLSRACANTGRRLSPT
jgi:hypothetical protein